MEGVENIRLKHVEMQTFLIRETLLVHLKEIKAKDAAIACSAPVALWQLLYKP
jgi:hypothetical protein